MRKLLCLGYRGKHCRQEKYVLYEKFNEAVNAKTSRQLQLRCRIPEVETLQFGSAHPYLKEMAKNQVHDDEKHFVKQFTATMFGQIVHVWHEVHVFVKYDTWNDFGKGNFISFPVIITHTSPESASSLQSLERFTSKNWSMAGGQSSQKRPTLSAEDQSAHVGGLVDRYTMGVMMSPEEISH